MTATYTKLHLHHLRFIIDSIPHPRDTEKGSDVATDKSSRLLTVVFLCGDLQVFKSEGMPWHLQNTHCNKNQTRFSTDVVIVASTCRTSYRFSVNQWNEPSSSSMCSRCPRKHLFLLSSIVPAVEQTEIKKSTEGVHRH